MKRFYAKFSDEELLELDRLAPTMTRRELVEYYGCSTSAIRYQVKSRGLETKPAKKWTEERCRKLLEMYSAGEHHTIIERKFGLSKGTLGSYVTLCNKHLNTNVPHRGRPHKYNKSNETTED